jgi:hypothetical protein
MAFDESEAKEFWGEYKTPGYARGDPMFTRLTLC